MKLIILDRDGVINKDRENYVKSVDEWEPLPQSIEAIALLSQSGYQIAIATNQSGLSRKLYSMHTMNEIHQKLHRLVNLQGGKISGIWFCPHTDADRCLCRKPKPGMIEDILSRFDITSASDVIMVGDSLRDLEAIAAVGGKPFLVKTGNGKKTLATGDLPSGTQIFDDLFAVAEHLSLSSEN